MRARAEIQGELADLERQRGGAVLDGRKFDASKVDRLNAELADIDAAETEETRRAREAAAEAFAKKQSERRSRIRALRGTYLSEIQAAEKAAHQLAEHLAAAKATAGELSGVCIQISGDASPSALSAYEVPHRLSMALPSVMAAVLGMRFGRIEWRSTSNKATVDWATREAAKTEDGAPRQVPMIPRAAVQIDASFYWRNVQVQLPDGVILDDLNAHPEMWKLVQQNPETALMRKDRVRMYAHDDSWYAEATVATVGRDRVTFGKITKFDFLTPRETVEDENYRSEFRNGGFVLINKKTGNQVGDQVYPTILQVRQAIAQQYTTMVR